MISEQLERFSQYWKDAEPILRLYLGNAIFNHSDAQDVLQRTALCAFKKFTIYDASQPFRAWVLGIARFEVLAYLRDHGRRKEVVDSEIAEQVRANVEDWQDQQQEEHAERQRFLQTIMEQLPERARQIIRLRFYEEKSYDEIAEIVNMNPGTVRTAVSRLVAKMRDYVKAHAREEA